MQPYDMKELEERVILVGVQESFSEDVEESLDELAELCETAGALVVGRVSRIVKRSTGHLCRKRKDRGDRPSDGGTGSDRHCLR